MKNDKLILKMLLAALVWTGGFLTIAAYAADKARQQDPQVFADIGNHLQIVGMGRHHSDYESSNDVWNIPAPTESIDIKMVSADVKIEVSDSAQVVQITASGDLAKSESPRLLSVDSSGKDLFIRQPDRDATRDLKINIVVPKSYHQELVIKTVSGDVEISQLNLKSLEASTVSGDLTVTGGEVNEVITKTVSGDVTLEGVAGPVEAKSVSGDVKIHLKDGIRPSVSAKSVSGGIVNRFPPDAEAKVTVVVKTTSGDISVL